MPRSPPYKVLSEVRSASSLANVTTGSPFLSRASNLANQWDWHSERSGDPRYHAESDPQRHLAKPLLPPGHGWIARSPEDVQFQKRFLVVTGGQCSKSDSNTSRSVLSRPRTGSTCKATAIVWSKPCTSVLSDSTGVSTTNISTGFNLFTVTANSSIFAAHV